MRMFRGFFCGVLCVLGVVICFVSAQAKPVTLKFAVVDPAQGPTVRDAYTPWAKMVEDAAGGTIKIQIYPGGTLGRDSRMQVKLVADGVADLSYIMPPASQGRFPEDEVFTLPGLAESGIEASLASQRMLDKGLLSGYDKDILCISHFTTDTWYLHTSFPARVPADLKGHKIRSSNDLWAHILDSFGAVPVGIQYVQAAENISRGMLEGTISDASAVLTFRVTDVAKNHTLAPLGFFPMAVVMNRKKFDSLPSEAQKALVEEGRKLGGIWQKAVQKEAEEKFFSLPDTDPKQKIIRLTPEEIQQWKDAFKPSLEWWAKQAPGRDTLIEQYQAELAAVRAELAESK